MPPTASVAPAARRIAIFLPTLNGGGAERVLLDLARRFLDLGHSVDLVLMSVVPDLPLNDLIPRNVRVVDLGCRRLWTSCPALVRYLRRERPAGLIAAMPLANAVAAYARLLARVPLRLVLTEHNARSLGLGDHDRWQDHLLGPFIRLGYRFADSLIAVSEGVAVRLREVAGNGARVAVIYNPAYSEGMLRLAEAPVPHEWLHDSSMPVVMGSGRLELQKDFETLLRAFALLLKTRPARLMILGEGSQREALMLLARNLGVEERVAFPGFVTNPLAYVARARVFVLSSIHEGLGNVLIEAMACGTPVVSTDCPAGPAEILEHGRYGALVPVRDPSSLARAIDAALDKPLSREALRSRAQFFSIDSAMVGYLRALQWAA